MTSRSAIAVGAVATLLLSLAVAGAMAEVPVSPAVKGDAEPLAAPEPVARALQANVMIETALADGRRSVASGVILQLRDGEAYIATGRHVVDPSLRGAGAPAASAVNDLTVAGVDGVRVSAKVEWLAPHGIDLAIVSAPLPSNAVRAARWDRTAVPRPGEAVFAVGNPDGAGWRHTSGSLTQIRDLERGGQAFQMLQSQVALGPGYSGGGLYDAEGRLIGINSLGGLPAGDSRFPGGIGLSVTFPTLLELAPARLTLPSH